jgi:hypothetical protein
MSVAWCGVLRVSMPHRVCLCAPPSQAQPPFASQRPHKDYGPGTRHTWSSSTSWSKGKVMRCMLIARIYGGCGCVCCSVGGLSETESLRVCAVSVRSTPVSTLDTAREPNALYRTRSARATASPRVRLRVPSRRPPGVRRRTHSKTRDNYMYTQTGVGQPTHAGMHAGRPTRHWDGPLGVGQLAS